MGFGEGLGQGEFESFGCCQEISFTVNVPHYVHTDHLMGTNVVTDKHGALEETLDYYPYGKVRIDESTGSFSEAHKFIGEFYDEESQLSYMNARYHDGKRGQFLSHDPSFLDIGKGKAFEQKYERTLAQHLTNPQALNSYSYAHNNPITLRDPDGEILPLLAAAWAIAEIGLSIYDGYNAYQTNNDPNATALEKSVATGGFVAGLIGPAGGYGKIGQEALQQIYSRTNASGRVLMEGVENSRVLNLIKDNYRATKGELIGSGSAVDAAIYTAETGIKVGGTDHVVKLGQNISRISNIFREIGSSLNAQETKALNHILNDTKKALNKIKKK